MISEKSKYTKKALSVNGKQMAYIDEGKGDAIVFLHGNPTSSFLWRNIMPHLEAQGRVLAPDLIGMGDSEKLEDSGAGRYRFVEHAQYLDEWLDAVGVGSEVTFVIHDWGSALGFHWAFRHQDRVKGIAYMEGIVRPMTWDEWPKAATQLFQGFRSPAGEKMILDQNMFVEQVLATSILRDLTQAEHDEYRRPFSEPGEDRRPTLTWPRQIPIEGEPEDVVRIVDDYGQWLAKSDLPKLFINAEPGAILRGEPREFCRSWPNQTEITVPGIHFVQEDSPDEIGQAISGWLSTLG